jgi:type IV secretion system protein VirB1
MLPGIELMNCQGLAVPAEVMHHVVRIESSFNPYAIGVVGGRLVRQPKNLPEALATVRMLETKGYNFSIGLAQVNRYNLDRYGLDSYEQAFKPCSNLVAGSKILAECYGRSGGDWGKSFSCYYSGNFTTGFRHGYVQKVYASIRQGRAVDAETGAQAIDVVGRNSRRNVPVSRHPLYVDPEQPAAMVQPVVSRSVSSGAPGRTQSVPSRVRPIAAAPTNETPPTVPETETLLAAVRTVAAVPEQQPENPPVAQARLVQSRVDPSPKPRASVGAPPVEQAKPEPDQAFVF